MSNDRRVSPRQRLWITLGILGGIGFGITAILLLTRQSPTPAATVPGTPRPTVIPQGSTGKLGIPHERMVIGLPFFECEVRVYYASENRGTGSLAAPVGFEFGPITPLPTTATSRPLSSPSLSPSPSSQRPTAASSQATATPISQAVTPFPVATSVGATSPPTSSGAATPLPSPSTIPTARSKPATTRPGTVIVAPTEIPVEDPPTDVPVDDWPTEIPVEDPPTDIPTEEPPTEEPPTEEPPTEEPPTEEPPTEEPPTEEPPDEEPLVPPTRIP